MADRTTEAHNLHSSNIDELSAIEIVQLMNREDANVAVAVGKQAIAIAEAVDVIANCFRTGGRLFYIGAGTSGRLGVLDASECPPTFNSPPGQVIGVIAGGERALTQSAEGAEDNPQQSLKDLAEHEFSAADVLVGIATSGRTPYVLGALEYARQLGAKTIGFACNEESELSPKVNIMIAPIVGPEVISGSTRLKAGTATKMVLNMLTTGAMILIGKTYGNLMVDLRASNSKLRERGVRIVAEVTGLDSVDALERLEACGGVVKVAIVSEVAGVDPIEAQRRLQMANGRLKDAIRTPDDRLTIEEDS